MQRSVPTSKAALHYIRHPRSSAIVFPPIMVLIETGTRQCSTAYPVKGGQPSQHGSEGSTNVSALFGTRLLNAGLSSRRIVQWPQSIKGGTSPRRALFPNCPSFSSPRKLQAPPQAHRPSPEDQPLSGTGQRGVLGGAPSPSAGEVGLIHTDNPPTAQLCYVLAVCVCSPLWT
ncbi:hypothetical protein B0T17DRAFT_172347 [Bombardia bombarda]|uniref:Uncharacterized protein n=1 Tax=Bombardia bombarda TaxID=252184 RepID=A0AA40C9A2_9PEZI|nr:hypothetical protein B0T17DRAFT_172347 [Bombardia bombarda]